MTCGYISGHTSDDGCAGVGHGGVVEGVLALAVVLVPGGGREVVHRDLLARRQEGVPVERHAADVAVLSRSLHHHVHLKPTGSAGKALTSLTTRSLHEKYVIVLLK